MIAMMKVSVRNMVRSARSPIAHQPANKSQCRSGHRWRPGIRAGRTDSVINLLEARARYHPLDAGEVTQAEV